MRFFRAALASLLVVLAFLAALPLSAQAATWAFSGLTIPPNSLHSQLLGVSCTATDACTATGRYFNWNVNIWGQWSLDWNGAAGWNLTGSPAFNPGDKNATLPAVDCVSDIDCMAVGSFGNSGHQQDQSQLKYMTIWVYFATVPLTSSGEELHGVSCVTTSYCLSVGRWWPALGVWGARAERWNGGSWTDAKAIFNTGPKNAVLHSASCIAVDACVTVGGYGNSSTVGVTLVETLTKTTWTQPASPNPTGAKYSVLQGVSCTAANACNAVGYYTSSGGVQLPFAMTYDGSTFSIKSVPLPAGASSGALNSVSCTSATACIAVGSYVSAGVTRALAESWNGSAWTVQSTPVSSPTFATLTSVSCTASTWCMAVGYDKDSAGADLPLSLKYS